MFSLLQSFAIKWQLHTSLTAPPASEPSDPDLAARLARAVALQKRAEQLLAKLDAQAKQSTHPA